MAPIRGSHHGTTTTTTTTKRKRNYWLAAYRSISFILVGKAVGIPFQVNTIDYLLSNIILKLANFLNYLIAWLQ
jgi:hypothetical protein